MFDAPEDVELARAWLRGEGALFDDLADLVESMMEKPLEAAARTFISTIGRDAKALAKGKPRPAPSARLTPAPPPAEPDAPLAPAVNLEEVMRRRRERNHAQRLAELGRRNAEAWTEQTSFLGASRLF
jgi:hypothetical protein